MSVCCCSLAGTAACQHCRNNPMATDVWTNKTVTVDHVEAKPFGNGMDVCPVCGKPSTIGKPQTNADRIREMTDKELCAFLCDLTDCPVCPGSEACEDGCGWDKENKVMKGLYTWLKQEADA